MKLANFPQLANLKNKHKPNQNRDNNKNHRAQENKKADAPKKVAAPQAAPAGDKPEPPDYKELLQKTEEIRQGMVSYLSELYSRVPQAFIPQPVPQFVFAPAAFQPVVPAGRGWGAWGAARY